MSPNCYLDWLRLRPWTRHSLVLTVAGLIFVGIGVSYIFAQPTEGKEAALHYALQWWSLDVWGYIFIAAGLASIVSSRWPPVSRTWGYTVLTGLSAGWACFYLVGILLGPSPATNISNVLTWAVIAFFWWAISGLVNPSDRR